MQLTDMPARHGRAKPPTKLCTGNRRDSKENTQETLKGAKKRKNGGERTQGMNGG